MIDVLSWWYCNHDNTVCIHGDKQQYNGCHGYQYESPCSGNRSVLYIVYISIVKYNIYFKTYVLQNMYVINVVEHYSVCELRNRPIIRVCF